MATLHSYTPAVAFRLLRYTKISAKEKIEDQKGKKSLYNTSKELCRGSKHSKKERQREGKPQLTGFLGKQFSVFIVLNKITSIVHMYINFSSSQRSSMHKYAGLMILSLAFGRLLWLIFLLFFLFLFVSFFFLRLFSFSSFFLLHLFLLWARFGSHGLTSAHISSHQFSSAHCWILCSNNLILLRVFSMPGLQCEFIRTFCYSFLLWFIGKTNFETNSFKTLFV